MLNIAEQLGIRNARRNGLRPYRTRNNSRGSSAQETAAGQCRRLAGHGPVSITGRKPEPGVMVGAISAITFIDPMMSKIAMLQRSNISCCSVAAQLACSA